MAETVDMVADVKTAIRITHIQLDGDIASNIAAASAELHRGGVTETMAYDYADPLIHKAVLTYCQSAYAKDKDEAERYTTSWKFQFDNLRKTKAYNTEENDGE